MPLPNSLYDEVMRTYEEQQFINHNILQKKYKEVYETIPRIKDLDNQISSLSIKQAKKLIEGDKISLTDIKEKLHLLFLKKKEALMEHGYPGDYLSEVYLCSDCKDTGFIDNKKCHCFKQKEIALLYSQSNLSEVLEEENFQTFDLSFYSDRFDPVTGRTNKENASIALSTCVSFVKDFANTHDNLLLFGDTGTGKTFLSHCIAGALLKNSYSVLYLTASQFFEAMANTKFHKGNDRHHVEDCDLLIIDDLGTELSNSFTNTEFFVVINDRLLRKKSTLISTNLSLDDIKNLYTERVFSRLSSSYTMLRLTGEDIRIKKKLKF